MAAERVQSLDAVRAIAIFAVLFVHAGMPGFEAGWLGVDLFFALSGFLITTLLLSEHARTGGIAYGGFLLRRALRLMPAYLLYVSVVTYGIWGWAGSVRSDHGGWTPLGYTLSLWTYANNFAPQGGLWNGQIVAVHLWSLAVEQQYYLVWPLVVIALAARPRALLLAGSVLTIASIAAFVFTPPGLYKMSLLPTRGFTLVLSSTAAVAAFHGRERLASLPWRGITFAGMVLVLIAFGLSASHAWTEGEVRDRLLPLLSLCFVAWTVALWYLPLPRRLAPWMLHPAVRYVGEVSYGVYLYHELVRVAVWSYAKPAMASWPAAAGYLTRLAIYIGLSIALAALSYEGMERRFLAMRLRFAR